MPTVLLFRPNFDLPTAYLSAWMGQVKDYATSNGYSVIDLTGSYATLPNFMAALQQNPDIVLIGTHGNATTLAGDLDSVLLVSCNNDGVLSGKEVVYGACEAGAKLGATTYQKGAEPVIAYVTDYIWQIDATAPSPDQDNTAEPFGELYEEPIKGLLSGLTAEQIYSQTMAKYEEVEARFKGSGSIVDEMMVADMENNRNGFVIYSSGGELKATPSSKLILILGVTAAVALGLWVLSSMGKK